MAVPAVASCTELLGRELAARYMGRPLRFYGRLGAGACMAPLPVGCVAQVVDMQLIVRSFRSAEALAGQLAIRQAVVWGLTDLELQKHAPTHRTGWKEGILANLKSKLTAMLTRVAAKARWHTSICPKSA